MADVPLGWDYVIVDNEQDTLTYVLLNGDDYALCLTYVSFEFGSDGHPHLIALFWCEIDPYYTTNYVLSEIERTRQSP